MENIQSADEHLKRAVDYVLGLVAKKEYSVLEVRRKLSSRYPEEIVEKCLKYCIDRNYVSDERFAKMYVRFRFHGNYGPVRIRYELKEKGICESIAEESLSDPEYDFEETLRDLVQRKASSTDLGDYGARSKLAAFLVRRGFESSRVLNMIGKLSRDPEE